MCDILKDDKYNLTNDFKFSLSHDIVNGLAFLHAKNIIHGTLKSRNCLIDYKWTVKIADWEYVKIYTHLNSKKNPLNHLRKTADDVGKNESAFLEFWTAPEIIKSGYALMPSMQGDIYSYSIILQEIFTRKDPYAEHYDTLSHSELIKAICDNNLRPTHTQDMPNAIKQIMDYGWSEDPLKRPTCDQIQKQLRQAHHFKKTVLDSMMEAVDDYTFLLEEKLEKNTKKLQSANEKLKYIQDKMVPPSLHRKLRHLPEFHIEQEMSSSVCILCLKLLNPTGASNVGKVHSNTKQPGKDLLNGSTNHAFQDAGDSTLNDSVESVSFVDKMEYADRKLQELCKQHKAYKMDYCDTFLVLCGIGSKRVDKKHVLNSCKIALEILTCDLTREVGLIWQGALHKGSIHTGLVNNGLPRCYIVGDPLEKTQELLRHSSQNKILISNEFSESLSEIQNSVYQMVDNGKCYIQVSLLRLLLQVNMVN